MNPETIAIHGYWRVSNPKNKKTGRLNREEKSIVIQQQTADWACNHLIPELFAGKKGTVVGEYSDEKSASRKRVRRPDFERLIADIEAGIVKVLMILNTSRLSRMNIDEAMLLHLKLKTYGVILVSMDDRKIIALGEFLNYIEVIFKAHKNNEEARTIGSNTLKGCLHSVKEGNAHCNLAPYGMQKLYITDTGERIYVRRGQSIPKGDDWQVHLVLGDRVEAKIVGWIFKTYATLDISPATIASQLNKHDDLQVRAGTQGNGWSEETVKWMLRNKHYNAKYFYGDRLAGEHYRTNGTAMTEVASKVTSPNPLDCIITA